MTDSFKAKLEGQKIAQNKEGLVVLNLLYASNLYFLATVDNKKDNSLRNFDQFAPRRSYLIKALTTYDITPGSIKAMKYLAQEGGKERALQAL